jgi:sugar phosphate isomerase/epimerase
MTEISYQLYSSREFPPLGDTMRMLKSIGYSQVEAYASLFDDLAGIKAALEQTGLSMPSSHFSLEMIEKEPGKVLDIAGTLGIRSIFCPYIVAELRPGDAAGWRGFGARLERAGEPLRAAGLGFGWHNHDFEFAALDDGSVPMEHILAGGPSLAWEADLAWIVRGGGDPVDWISRHGDRMTAVHVKDIAPAGECADEDGWADVGFGTMDWKALFDALKSSAAVLFIMEHDKPSDDERFARRSFSSVKRFKG